MDEFFSLELETIKDDSKLVNRIKESTDNFYDSIIKSLKRKNINFNDNHVSIEFLNSEGIKIKITKILIDNQKELQALHIETFGKIEYNPEGRFGKEFFTENYMYMPIKFKNLKNKFAFGLNPFSNLKKNYNKKQILELVK